MTQLGRVEFALVGGRVFTDFIDNAGGVHCSDREVNLKVLLGLAEARGELDREGRDQLVDDVVDDVVAAILYDNFLQAQILSQDVDRSAHHIEAYEDLMSVLESEGMLDRSIERLPSSDDMNERARNGVGMTAPELSVLLAYAKRSLRKWLLESDLPDWDDFGHTTDEYFPAQVRARFGHLIPEHPLKRELTATIVANRVVNSEGVTFVTRLMAETGAAPEAIVRAYHIARAVTEAADRWQAVEALVGQVPTELVRDLMQSIDDLVESVARWYLSNPHAYYMRDEIAEAKPAFEELAVAMVESAPAEWRRERDVEVEQWAAFGVPSLVAHRHIYQSELIHAPDIIAVARATDRSFREVSEVFLLTGSAFEIDWLESQVEELPVSTRWQRRAQQTVSEDLVLLRRQLAEKILTQSTSPDAHTALEHYLVARTHELGRLTRFMRMLAGDGVTDVASVIVAHPPDPEPRGLTPAAPAQGAVRTKVPVPHQAMQSEWTQRAGPRDRSSLSSNGSPEGEVDLGDPSVVAYSHAGSEDHLAVSEGRERAGPAAVGDDRRGCEVARRYEVVSSSEPQLEEDVRIGFHGHEPRGGAGSRVELVESHQRDRVTDLGGFGFDDELASRVDCHTDVVERETEPTRRIGAKTPRHGGAVDRQADPLVRLQATESNGVLICFSRS